MLGNGIHLRNSIACFATGIAYTQGVCRIRSAPPLLTAARSDVSFCCWKKQTLIYRNLRRQAPHNALWSLEPSPSAAVASIDSREQYHSGIAGIYQIAGWKIAPDNLWAGGGNRWILHCIPRSLDVAWSLIRGFLVGNFCRLFCVGNLKLRWFPARSVRGERRSYFRWECP